MALIGLSFLLFIAGLKVDYERFRGRLLKLTGIGFALSIAIGTGDRRGTAHCRSRPLAVADRDHVLSDRARHRDRRFGPRDGQSLDCPENDAVREAGRTHDLVLAARDKPST
jgi:hypothetical protein